MNFTKIQGTGNDFVFINNIEEKIPKSKLGLLAKYICTRRMSIGADGLMVIDNPTEDGDYKMLFFNADGSLGEMCGNGARCACRYGYEKGLAGETQKVETTAGLVVGNRIDRRHYKIRLNEISTIKMDKKVYVDGREINYSYVELGNPGLPHVVISIPGLKDIEKECLRELGKTLRHHEIFPKGANINFYDISDKNHITVLTYERGVEDFTLACGTGTGSVVSVLALKNQVDAQNVKARVLGGELLVSVVKDETDTIIKDIYLSGVTNIVAEGVVVDEELFEKLNI